MHVRLEGHRRTAAGRPRGQQTGPSLTSPERGRAAMTTFASPNVHSPVFSTTWFNVEVQLRLQHDITNLRLLVC